MHSTRQRRADRLPHRPVYGCYFERTAACGPILWADPGLRTAEATQKIGPMNDLHQEGRSAPGSIGSIGSILEPYEPPRVVPRASARTAGPRRRLKGVHELMTVAVL